MRLRLLAMAIATIGASFVATPVFAASPCPYSWATTLSSGSTGGSVLTLQEFLNTTGFQIAASGPGSPSNETTLFGALTKAAVVRFQEKYASEILAPNGLSYGTGLVGASTRAKLNSLCMAAAAAPIATSTTPVAASATSSLTVTMPVQPTQTLAPSFALYVPFTNVTLTAGASDVTVNSITIERVGPASDQAFADVDLFDSSGAFISIAYFTSDHKAVFRDPITIPAGTSETFSVVGDIADATDHGGEIAGMQIDAIDASAPVIGSLPVRGTYQTLNDTLAIGEAFSTVSGDDPMTDRVRYINDTDIRFSGIRVTAGTEEDIRINSVAWEQSGSASAEDIKNVRTIVNGVSYAAEVDGRSYTSTFPGGITLAKGNSVDLVVEGDITTSGSNRTVKFDLRYGTDVDITGLTYGYGIALVPSDSTATTGNSVFLTTDGTPDGASLQPFYSGSVTSIQGGSLVGIGK